MIYSLMRLVLTLIGLAIKCIGIGCKYGWRLGRWWWGAGSKTLGSARFSGRSDLKKAGLLNAGGLLLGTVEGRSLYSRSDDHLMCVAPTKSGKTSSLVIPNLLSAGDASVVVNDPSGEAWAITRRARTKVGKVFIWAPFAATTDCFNPLDFVQVGTEDERDDVEVIVSLLVPDSERDDDKFWNSQAREVLAGLILYVLHTRPKEDRHMGMIRHLLTISEDAFDELLRGMVHCGHPLVRRTAHNILQQDSKLRSGVLATARTYTGIWDSPRLVNATRQSDFDFGALRQEVASIYLVVPPERLATYYPALALLAGLSVAAISRSAHRGDKRVIFLLDEFANLGRLKPVETAITIARKAGVQLCLFVQDMAQLQRVYGDSWRTFAANCATKIYFGVNEIKEAQNVSETLGMRTVQTRSTGHQVGLTQILPDRMNGGQGEAARALRTPDEVMNLRQEECLICQQGVRPILARKAFYQDRRFKGLWDEWDGRPPYSEILDFQEAFAREQRGEVILLPAHTVIELAGPNY